MLTRNAGLLVVLGLALLGFGGCHDDDHDHKVRSHRDRPVTEKHHGGTDVDVHVGVGHRDEPAVVAEPAPVVVEEPAPVVVEEPPPVVVERRQPDVVVVHHGPPMVVVHEHPPAVIVERRPPPPARTSIWIEGYWHHDGHRFNWVKGHYDKPRKGQHYVQAQWRQGPNGWELYAGYWQKGK